MKSELMQQRCVDIRYIVRRLNRMETDLVRCSVNLSAADSATGKPDGETVWMVVTAIPVL